jgi:hypothetical protein
MILENRSRQPPPFLMQELEKTPSGQVWWPDLVKSVQLVCNLAQVVRHKKVAGRQRPAPVKRLNPANVIVMMALGGNALRPQREEGSAGFWQRIPMVKEEKPLGSSNSKSSIESLAQSGNSGWH